MNEYWIMMKDDEGWRMTISSCWGVMMKDRQTDKWIDICECSCFREWKTSRHTLSLLKHSCFLVEKIHLSFVSLVPHWWPELISRPPWTDRRTPPHPRGLCPASVYQRPDWQMLKIDTNMTTRSRDWTDISKLFESLPMASLKSQNLKTIFWMVFDVVSYLLSHFMK